MKRISGVLAGVVLLAGISGMAMAEETAPSSFSMTVGLKAWASEWQLAGTGTNYGKATAFIPSVSLKYGDAFLSFGKMTKTHYLLDSNRTSCNPACTLNPPMDMYRDETDVAIGYYVHPQLAVLLGYKESNVNFYSPPQPQNGQVGGDNTVKWKVPSIGVAATAPFQGTSSFMYCTIAAGKASISTQGPNVNGGGGTFKGGMYTNTEVGFGWATSPHFRVTAGYRYQTAPVNIVSNNVNNPSQKELETTRGLIFGGSYTF